VPWKYESFEIPPTSIETLLELAKLRPSDVFVDLGSGTGSVVTKAVELCNVKMAIGVETEMASRDSARRVAVRTLSKEQLERVDFWLGNFHSEDFYYDDVTVAYNSCEEDEEEIGFYRENLPRHFRLLKKDLPLVGYRAAAVSRKGRVWFFRMDFPRLSRIRNKSEWARSVLGRESTMDDVYDYYRRVLVKRGISKKEIRLAMNRLEYLVILRF
jgi:hypothetical protein